MKPYEDLRATADQINSLDAIEISGNDPFGVLPGHQGPARWGR